MQSQPATPNHIIDCIDSSIDELYSSPADTINKLYKLDTLTYSLESRRQNKNNLDRHFENEEPEDEISLTTCGLVDPPFSENEVKLTAFKFGKRKSSGPEGIDNTVVKALEELHEGDRLVLYADDQFLIIETASRAKAEKCVETSLQIFSIWAHDSGLKFNVSKTKALSFKPRDIRTKRKGIKWEHKPAIRKEGRRVALVNRMTILGVVIDDKMGWQYQAEEMVARGREALCRPVLVGPQQGGEKEAEKNFSPDRLYSDCMSALVVINLEKGQLAHQIIQELEMMTRAPELPWFRRHSLIEAMAAALQKFDIDPEQQLYTPKIVDIAADVMEMHGNLSSRDGMAFRKRKEVKKQSYYVWFLGAKESKGLRGDEYIRPVLRSLLARERELDPMKVTVQVSSKGLKIIQNVARKAGGKTEQVKHFIPHHAVTCATQTEDVVCAILLIYNPLTKCPVHVHAYRCDSVETAESLRSQLQQLIDRPDNQKKFLEIESRLDAKGLLPMKRLNSDGRSTRTEGSDPSTDDTNESERGENKGQIATLYDSLAAELRARLKNSKSCPILLPPKDYDTVSRSKGKLNGIIYRKSTNAKLVGVNVFPKGVGKQETNFGSSNKSTGKSSGKSSGIGSDEALSTAIQEVSPQEYERKGSDSESSSDGEEDWVDPVPADSEIIEWPLSHSKESLSYKQTPSSKILDRKESKSGQNQRPEPKKNAMYEKNSEDWRGKSSEYINHKSTPIDERIKHFENTSYKSPDNVQAREIWHYAEGNKPYVKKEYIHPITIDTCVRDPKGYSYVDARELKKSDVGKKEINYGRRDKSPSNMWQRDHRPMSYPNLLEEDRPEYRSVPYYDKENLKERRSHSPASAYRRQHPSIMDSDYYSRNSGSPKRRGSTSPDDYEDSRNGYRSPERTYSPTRQSSRKYVPPVVQHSRRLSPDNRRGRSPDYDPDPRRALSPSRRTFETPRRPSRYEGERRRQRSGSNERPYTATPSDYPRGRRFQEPDERRKSAYFDPGLVDTRNYRNSFAESHLNRLALHQQPQY
ncbi:hypothetical protein LAZ67_1004283 [Cordylochernes scorpioides]|uniref:PID domain-containing protein n=1 Tax=Cordylochernes scorpioides TaxID=51811 RepID=A0ABY6K0A7_9ARAC|nr:hypothetical protein LAZ67_1004283 [Cordylochernes scorpioides]